MKLKRAADLLLIYLVVIGFFLSVSYWGSVATTAVAEMIPMEREATIIIDAGHGGVDGGATSCSGVLESKFNLDIALRLRDLLHLLGYRTQMIRTTDRSVYTSGETIAAQKVSDLRFRVKTVNETEDALLVSIHQNTFSDGRYCGAQVFYAPAENSRDLAQKLQSAFAHTINPENKRKAKTASGIYLMQQIKCTGILVECGFLSNPEEEAKLRSSAYQKQVSCVIAATVSEFLDQSQND